MSPSAPLMLISAVLLFSAATTFADSTTSAAINITKLLEKYPDYSEFSGLLTKTHLAQEINNHKSVTILALKNGQLGQISGKSEDIQKRILSSHIVLDYFDVEKLNKLNQSGTVLTTLFQSSGMARDQQGFLNATKMDGGVVIGSAMKGAPLASKLEEPVASQPYDVSVLSISQPIVAPGIESVTPVAAGPNAAHHAASPADNAMSPTSEKPTKKGAAHAPSADSPLAEGGTSPSPAPSAAGKLVSSGLMVVLASVLAAF